MPAASTTPLTPAESELHDAIKRLLEGRPDSARVRQAATDMDRIRQELERTHGVLDIGVPAIRELRGSLPDE